jgi:putative iron-only hydrogenase system regulator
MRKVAIVSAVLDDPLRCQSAFNNIVSEYRHLIRGRMGIPMPNEGLSLISFAVMGNLNDINSLTDRLGRLEGVSIKTAMSKKDF